jgi:hypothetical protein
MSSSIIKSAKSSPVFILITFLIFSCDFKKSDPKTSPSMPVLEDLTIEAFNLNSITLGQPTFSIQGNPEPSILAYIGEEGTISVKDTTVSNYTEGTIDVSSGSYTFAGLSSDTAYRIIVVAKNSEGSSVRQVTQNTDYTVKAPVMNNLKIIDTTEDTIILDKPEFSVTGKPDASISAYIGLEGTISISGTSVSDYTDGPMDVAAGGCAFTGLQTNSLYRIIVVAENSEGFSVRQILQSTDLTAPVLFDLETIKVDTYSIEIGQLYYSTVGNPIPAGRVYIGIDGVISVTGSEVTGYEQGPVEPSSDKYLFTGLLPYTDYRIIAVAENDKGFSVKETVRKTDGAAPILNNLQMICPDDTTAILERPAFFNTGYPAPKITAYYGIEGNISISGASVSGYMGQPVVISSDPSPEFVFADLELAQYYRIIVVAENIKGSSVRQIVRHGVGVSPELNDLVVTNRDKQSITLSRASFYKNGYPAANVSGYIGYDGQITVSGVTVSNKIAGPVDLLAGDYTFSSLISNKKYKIIAIAANTEGNSVKTITCQTSDGWGSPEIVVSDITKNADIPAAAIDTNGNIIIVWSQSGTVYANRYKTGTGWEGVTSLGPGYNPRVVIRNANGDAAAVWASSYRIKAMNYMTATGWQTTKTYDLGEGYNLIGAASDMSTMTYVVWTWYTNTGYTLVGNFLRQYTPTILVNGTSSIFVISNNISNAKISVNGINKCTIFWQQSYTTSYNYGFSTRYATVNKLNANKWSPGVSLENNGTNITGNYNVFNSISGSFEAIWQDKTDVRNSTFGASSGLDWSQNQTVGSSGYNPNIVVDSSGNKTAVMWKKIMPYLYNIFIRRFKTADGIWSEPENSVAGLTSNPDESAIAIDNNGCINLIWKQNITTGQTNSTVMASRYNPETDSWSVPLPISSLFENASNPVMSFNASGSGVAVWKQFNGSNWVIYANRYR